MRNVFQVLLGLTALFGLGIGLAFGGGVLYGRTTASAAPTPQVVSVTGGGGAGGSTGAGSAGGTGAAGGQGGAQARGVAAGIVEKIEGNTITLRTQQGTTTVTFTGDTEVRQTVAAQAADIRAGQTLTIAGTPGADGNLQARTITISPTGTSPTGTSPAGGQQGGQGSRRQTPQATASPTATPTPGR